METDDHRGARPTAQRFLRFTQQRPELLAGAAADFRSGVFEVVGTVSGLPREMEQPLQPWPTWLDAERVEEFQRVSVGLARIFRSIPERLFGGDPKKIASFLGMPDDLMASLLLAEPNFLHQTICRGDFIETDHGLKLIEFNMGNLGGWQHYAFEPLYQRQPAVQAFLEETGLAASCRNSVEALLRHVVRHTLGTALGTGRELGLLVVASNGGLSGVDSHPVEVYERELRAVMQAEAPDKSGRIEVVPVGELEFPGGELHARGRRFHAVIEQNDQRPSREIFRCFKAGGVNCYTSPLGMVLGDKKLLALLSSEAGSEHFDVAERKLLEDHLPWTRKITARPLRFRGDEGGALEILRRHREALVLKAGSSFGGADVHVGPSTPPDRWQEVTAAATAGDGWVAQEYLAGRPQVYPAVDGGAQGQEFDLAWGLYVFGEEYGGAFLRMAPRGEMPVLNVAQGARIGLALEVGEAGRAA